MRFKEFLINEQQAYLGQKVGDILTAVQELMTDAQGMGTRDLVRYTQQVVNQIRPILHSSWPREEKKFLLTLQKVAVSLSKAIEDKGDLPSKLAGNAEVLQKLVADLGVPINKLSTTDSAPPTPDSKGTDISAQGEAKAEAQPGPPPAEGQKTAPDAPPGAAAPQEELPQAGSPLPPDQGFYAPSLGGSSGPLEAF